MKSKRKLSRCWSIWLAGALLTACSDSPPAAMVAEESRPTIRAIGFLEPRGELRRLSFRESGILAEEVAEVGQSIEKGAVIARLGDDTERRELELVRSQLAVEEQRREVLRSGAHPAEVRRAEAQLALAKIELAYRQEEKTRHDALDGKQGISRAQLESVHNDFDAAAMRVRVARAALETLENQLRPADEDLATALVDAAKARVHAAEAKVAEMELRAPEAGVVVEYFLRAGESVSALMESPAVLFAPAGRVDIRAEVDETFLPDVRLGSAAKVHGPDGEVTEATVRRIKPIMGRKKIFARRATERLDMQVIEVWIEAESELPWPYGTEVEVEIEGGLSKKSQSDAPESVLEL